MNKWQFQLCVGLSVTLGLAWVVFDTLSSGQSLYREASVAHLGSAPQGSSMRFVDPIPYTSFASGRFQRRSKGRGRDGRRPLGDRTL